MSNVCYDTIVNGVKLLAGAWAFSESKKGLEKLKDHGTFGECCPNQCQTDAPSAYSMEEMANLDHNMWEGLMVL